MSRGLLLLLGAILSAAIATIARASGSLTRDGALAAVIVGTLVFGFGGYGPALLLVTFFLTSSLLTRWHAERKSHPEHRRGRTGAQVGANGGVAVILSVWYGLAPSADLAAAIGGAIAAATADTWATEVGMLSRMPPRMITTWRVVAPGSSGAVTGLGTAAGVLGAALLAVMASILLESSFWRVWPAAILAMMLDSVLGATIEHRVGIIDNNAVNLLATAAAAAIVIVDIL